MVILPNPIIEIVRDPVLNLSPGVTARAFAVYIARMGKRLITGVISHVFKKNILREVIKILGIGLIRIVQTWETGLAAPH